MGRRRPIGSSRAASPSRSARRSSILIGLLVASVWTGRTVASLHASSAVTIEVTGHQWWWEIEYEDAVPSRRVVTANEIHIPLHRPVVLKVTSRDVIHSFWVPNLQGKRDLIPGYTTAIWLQADRPGVFRGQCAEFCGLQHAHMAFDVVAEPEADFERWLDGMRQPAPRPAERGRAARPRRLHDGALRRLPHRFSGTDAHGQVAPDLTHVATRSTLGAGTLPNTPEHLRAWVRDPQASKPGNQMPPNPLPRRRSAGAARLPGDAAMTRRRELPHAGEDLAMLERDLGRARRARRLVARTSITSRSRAAISSPRSSIFLIGGVLAALMRLQLSRPDNTLIGPDLYNQIFTTHGTTMMFLFAVPVMQALGIYFVPLMVGARSIAFPRLVAFSYWMFLFGGIFLYVSFLLNAGPDVGWFSYPPLAEALYTPSKRADVWAQLITFTEVASLAVAVSLITTVFKLRAPGMTLNRIPIFVWAQVVTSFMVLFAMPAVMLASTALILDRLVNTHFFDVEHAGDALLWQHLFWFFGHPEVYIIFIPGSGLVSTIITDLLAPAACSATWRSCCRWSRPRSWASACGSTTCSRPACRSSARASSPPPAS